MSTIPLIGSTYQSKSVAAECQRTINWYVEAIESQAGKAPAVLYPTPGLRPLVLAPTSPWRGLWAAPTATVGVAGSTFYEITTTDPARPTGSAVLTSRAGIVSDGKPVSFADNGTFGQQILFASGGYGYLFNTSTKLLIVPTIAADLGAGNVPTTVLAVAYMDGMFLAFAPNLFQWSNDFRSGGGTTWDATKYARRSEGADPIVTGLQNRREVWVLGQLTSEVWYNTGSADNIFAPIPGVFIEMGCAAAASAVRFDQSVAWLGQNRDGDRLAVIAAQYLPQRVSTHAIENTWRRYARVDDAVSFVYQDEGHAFWVLSFPSAQATWVYDAATQQWHERGWWNAASATFDAHRATSHAFSFGTHLVGDRASGQLYALDNRISTDTVPASPTTAIRRVRRTPHIADENQVAFYSKLELELETGLGLATGQGQHPQAMLRWSDDRAHTWTPEWWLDTSPMGTYNRRVDFWRLGRSRDRVFELAVSDPIPWRLISAYLTARRGSS